MPDRESDGREGTVLANPLRAADARCRARAARPGLRRRACLLRRAGAALRGWRRIAWLPLLPALAGCLPDQATFSFGLTTTQIVGEIELDASDSSGPPLILVYEQHHMFMELESGLSPTRTSAHLVPVRRDGSFAIAVPNDVVSIDAFFIAPQRLTDEFRFHKQLGIGRIVYRPRMPRMADWRSHFYTFLLPELEHVIAEPRYGMPEPDQAALGSWILDQRGRLEASRKPEAES